MTIEPLRAEHWDAVARIYAEGIATGHATFEADVPSWEQWEKARRQGVGRELLEALIAGSEAAGIWTIQTGIFPENEASVRLHERVGFRIVARASVAESTETSGATCCSSSAAAT